jgi:polyvinyl alcohol dehydrogenase (cytochrome)
MHTRGRRFWAAFVLLVGCSDEELVPPIGESWPSFGRDHQNSRANLAEQRITKATVAGLQEAWRVPLAGCTSTPAVVGGLVYVGDWEGNVHALYASDGSTYWETAASEGSIDASPLVLDDRVFVGDSAGDFFALDAKSGEEIWRVHLDDHESTHVFGSAGGAEGLVFVGVASIELVATLPDYTFRGSLVALDAATGEERWRVYMTEDDAESGAGVSVWSSVAIDTARQRLFIGTGQTYEAPASPRADALVAVDYTTGEVAWVRQFTEDDVYTIFQPPPQGPDADIGSAPNLFVAGGVDAVGVGDKAGVYAAIDRDTGDTIWGDAELTPGSHLGGVMNAGAYANGVVYVNSNHFTLEIGADALDAPDPANTNTTLALGADTGAELWRVEQPYPSVGGLAWAGGVVYHGSTDGTLHAMDADSGEELWSAQVGPSMASGVSLVDGTLFVPYGFRFFLGSGPIDGGLVAYRLP